MFNRNNVKTAVLLASLGGALVTAGSLLGGSGGAVIGMMLGLVMVGGSYWFSDKLAIRAANAQSVNNSELAWLVDDLNTMSQRAGIRPPRLYISPSMQPNAFATGRNEKTAVVCVTLGLLQVLDRREVRAVVAHELGHIKNRDILIGSVAAAIATGITSIAQVAMFSSMGDDDDGPNPIVLMGMMLLAPIAASLIQASLSRSREFEADRVGAEIAGDGASLAQALRTIENYAQRVPMRVNPAQASAYIVNPFTGRNVQFARLFMTHPPTDERVARLMGARS